MKEYELKYIEGEDGIFAMSTVANPAVKSTLVMFSDEKQVFEFADDEKQIIYSVAMRPNILIPRENINGAPAKVFYSEETADALLQNFFEKNAHQGATIDHGGKVIKDMFIFSAWKVLDPERDAAAVMGLDVKRGDIVMGQKVNNPEVWKRIKNKELTGFSFEAILNPVLTKTQTQMSAEEIDARIKEVIKMTAEEDALAMKKAEEDALAMAAHDKEMKMAKDKEMEMAKHKEMKAAEHTPEGTHMMPDGSTMLDADMAAADPAAMQKTIDDLTSENLSLKAQVAELQAVSLTMSAENSAAKKVALEMSAQLGKGITPNGGTPAPVKTYAEMSNIEKAKYNRGI
jgi:hypothetical protein